MPVVRPPNDVPKVKTPAHVWVIPSAQDPDFLPSASTRLLIRQEYYNILVALLWYLDRKREAAPAHMKRTFPPAVDDRRDVDDVPPRQVNVPPNQNYSPDTDELCIPERIPDISEATVFPNPFLDPHQGNLYRGWVALIITGLPGMGKTAFLAVIFWLRVAANLPTAYMVHPKAVLVYTGAHFFCLRDPNLLPLALGKSAWVLVDSNVNNKAPPQDVIDSGFFIVQAASPGPSCTQWAVKNQGSGIRSFCLMQPWTLDELFAGSSLQIKQRTGADMHAFFLKFGGSARLVYDSCHRLSAFDEQVKIVAGKLADKTELIMQAIQLPTLNWSFDDKVGDLLVTPLPLDDRDRTQFRMASPTSYLQDLLVLQLDTNLHTARRFLRGLARQAPSLVYRRGWLVAPSQVRKLPHARSGATANMWQAQEEDCGQILLADGRMSIEPASKAKQQPKALAIIRTPTSELEQLHEHQLYRVRESNFRTFDSFYIDRSNHVFVFQALEADKTHTVNDLGRVWMEDHGITEFTYIYVSPPKTDTRPTISLPVEHESKFIGLYHLVLDYPEVRDLLDMKVALQRHKLDEYYSSGEILRCLRQLIP